jgi:hypothetical protein
MDKLKDAQDWMKQNRVGLDVPEWQSRHPDWRKVTDVARTFDQIDPQWRGQIQEAA